MVGVECLKVLAGLILRSEFYSHHPLQSQRKSLFKVTAYFTFGCHA